jgi:hypothetical protein
VRFMLVLWIRSNRVLLPVRSTLVFWNRPDRGPADWRHSTKHTRRLGHWERVPLPIQTACRCECGARNLCCKVLWVHCSKKKYFEFLEASVTECSLELSCVVEPSPLHLDGTVSFTLRWDRLLYT